MGSWGPQKNEGKKTHISCCEYEIMKSELPFPLHTIDRSVIIFSQYKQEATALYFHVQTLKKRIYFSVATTAFFSTTSHTVKSIGL